MANCALKLAIFKHDIPALYATHVSGLSIKNLEVHWDASLSAYFTNAINCYHFQNLNINGIKGSVGPNAAANEAVIALRDGNGVVISNEERASGTNGRQLLSQEHVLGLVSR